MKKIIIIPARYGSTRLPGKPLIPINGVPMIVRVLRQCHKVNGIDEVIVATDDEQIADLVTYNGGKAELTRGNHKSGTDRVAEVALGYEQDNIIINVQGDMPFVDLDVISTVANADTLNNEIVTPAIRIIDGRINDPSTVKVICNGAMQAMYFSRSPIPHERKEGIPIPWKHHIGIYAYRNANLQKFVDLYRPYIEEAEGLEQLRALYAGWRIRVEMVDSDCGAEINTPEDVARVNK